MQLILSPFCRSLTGSLKKGAGFTLKRRTDALGHVIIYAVRTARFTPGIADSRHLLFIRLCADLANGGFPVTGISVPAEEFAGAVMEMLSGQRLDDLPDHERLSVLNQWRNVQQSVCRHNNRLLNASDVIQLYRYLQTLGYLD